jgi:hypothetical protein
MISMTTTREHLIAGLQARLTEVSALLARGVSERDLDEALPGSALWDARVHLGLDGKTGARDVRSDVGLPNRAPVVLAVDPGVQVEQAKPPYALVDGQGGCGCCRGSGDHPCGHECDSCDGSGRNPDSPVCTLPHGGDCTCTAEATA